MTPRSPHAAHARLLDEIGAVDCVGVEERVAKYMTRSIKKASKVWGLRMAVSMTDLTTLEGKDTPGKIESLCRKALHPHDDPAVPPVAAVCVYPSMVRHAKRWVGGSGCKVASVATAFPSGQTHYRTRLAEVRGAVADGADEVDMVINRGAFLSGDFSEGAGRDSRRRRGLRGRCAQGDPRGERARDVRQHPGGLVSRDGRLRPGDFIKTSTGKTSLNATLGSNQVMIEAIRDFYLDTAVPIGMKPAGGIRTAKQSLQYLIAVKETLGDAWLTPRRYRFGATSLLNDLLRQIERERTGAYQAPY
jgi:deoxyribose-phosphate aldolase